MEPASSSTSSPPGLAPQQSEAAHCFRRSARTVGARNCLYGRFAVRAVLVCRRIGRAVGVVTVGLRWRAPSDLRHRRSFAGGRRRPPYVRWTGSARDGRFDRCARCNRCRRDRFVGATHMVRRRRPLRWRGVDRTDRAARRRASRLRGARLPVRGGMDDRHSWPTLPAGRLAVPSLLRRSARTRPGPERSSEHSRLRRSALPLPGPPALTILCQLHWWRSCCRRSARSAISSSPRSSAASGSRMQVELIPGHGGLMDRLDGFLAAAGVGALFGLLRGGIDTPARGLIVW